MCQTTVLWIKLVGSKLIPLIKGKEKQERLCWQCRPGGENEHWKWRLLRKATLNPRMTETQGERHILEKQQQIQMHFVTHLCVMYKSFEFFLFQRPHTHTLTCVFGSLCLWTCGSARSQNISSNEDTCSKHHVRGWWVLGNRLGPSGFFFI